jgi:tetratricopeptide repeat protein 21B
MAEIYLTKKHDRKKYAACFKEVVEKRPTVDSCIMLGNAFIKIQEVSLLNSL